jgi:hypothetical protein
MRAATTRFVVMRACAKSNAGVTASAFVPLTFAPGEACQLDWSHEIVVARSPLSQPDMFVRAYPRETQEMVFDALSR